MSHHDPTLPELILEPLLCFAAVWLVVWGMGMVALWLGLKITIPS